MGVAGVSQMSNIMPVGRSDQDSHEKNIQRQISNLQERVKNVAYDREKSAEEKKNEKKELQEQIQSLNSELKQYRIQKQQKEEVRQQEEAAKAEERTEADARAAVRKADEASAEAPEQGFGSKESGVIITISHTKDQLADMRRIRTALEGKMRTAETEEEKRDIQERISKVSQNMGEKIRKISDTIAENMKDEEERKDKISKIQKENEERLEHIKAVVPKTGGLGSANGYRKENFTVSVS